MSDTAATEEEINYFKCAKFTFDIFAKALRLIFRDEFQSKFGYPWVDTKEYGSFLVDGRVPPWEQNACTLCPIKVSLSAAASKNPTPQLKFCDGTVMLGSASGQFDKNHAIRLG